MDIEALVRKGRNKERCEDRCLNGRSVLCDIDGRCSIDGAFIAAVADGVGGNQLGDVAAGYVLQQLAAADVELYSGTQRRADLAGARHCGRAQHGHHAYWHSDKR